MEEKPANLMKQTQEIVSAYASRNAISPEGLTDLIDKVHRKLLSLNNSEEAEPEIELKPAVPIKKSITPEYIVCLEDGKRFKSLKRHIRAHYNLSPEQYREKWGLKPNYPMVAPNYTVQRSNLAKDMGLGRKR